MGQFYCEFIIINVRLPVLLCSYFRHALSLFLGTVNWTVLHGQYPRIQLAGLASKRRVMVMSLLFFLYLLPLAEVFHLRKLQQFVISILDIKPPAHAMRIVRSREGFTHCYVCVWGYLRSVGVSLYTFHAS